MEDVSIKKMKNMFPHHTIKDEKCGYPTKKNIYSHRTAEHTRSSVVFRSYASERIRLALHQHTKSEGMQQQPSRLTSRTRHKLYRKRSRPKRRKKQQRNRSKMSGTHNFNVHATLSLELAAFVGAPTMPRKDLTAFLWRYAKEHRLIERGQIICDGVLRELFQVERIGFFDVQGLLNRHIISSHLSTEHGDVSRSSSRDACCSCNNRDKTSIAQRESRTTSSNLSTERPVLQCPSIPPLPRIARRTEDAPSDFRTRRVRSPSPNSNNKTLPKLSSSLSSIEGNSKPVHSQQLKEIEHSKNSFNRPPQGQVNEPLHVLQRIKGSKVGSSQLPDGNNLTKHEGQHQVGTSILLVPPNGSSDNPIDLDAGEDSDLLPATGTSWMAANDLNFRLTSSKCPTITLAERKSVLYKEGSRSLRHLQLSQLTPTLHRPKLIGATSTSRSSIVLPTSRSVTPLNQRTVVKPLPSVSHEISSSRKRDPSTSPAKRSPPNNSLSAEPFTANFFGEVAQAPKLLSKEELCKALPRSTPVSTLSKRKAMTVLIEPPSKATTTQSLPGLPVRTVVKQSTKVISGLAQREKHCSEVFLQNPLPKRTHFSTVSSFVTATRPSESLEPPRHVDPSSSTGLNFSPLEHSNLSKCLVKRDQKIKQEIPDRSRKQYNRTEDLLFSTKQPIRKSIYQRPPVSTQTCVAGDSSQRHSGSFLCIHSLELIEDHSVSKPTHQSILKSFQDINTPVSRNETSAPNVSTPFKQCHPIQDPLSEVSSQITLVPSQTGSRYSNRSLSPPKVNSRERSFAPSSTEPVNVSKASVATLSNKISLSLKFSNILRDSVTLELIGVVARCLVNDLRSAKRSLYARCFKKIATKTEQWEEFCRHLIQPSVLRISSVSLLKSEQEFRADIALVNLDPADHYKFIISLNMTSSLSVINHSNTLQCGHSTPAGGNQHQAVFECRHSNVTLESFKESEEELLFIAEAILMPREYVKFWTTEEVIIWASSLNIEGFAEQCRKVGVIGEELVEFCEQDLKELGITTSIMIHKWFPSNSTVSFMPAHKENDDAKQRRPRARLLCFHSAGSDSSIFTSKGTAKRPMPNPLLSYCVENDIQLLAVHLPGRTSRCNEPMMTTPLAVAECILDLLEPMLQRPKTPSGNNFELSEEVPLVVAGHSMGAFIAYEFLCLMRQREIPMPKHILLSCMVSPDTPKNMRPWRPQETLDSDQLKNECRAWGVNDEVFLPEMWKIYEPILRGDLNLIDCYTFAEPGKGTLKKTPESSRSTSPASSPLGTKQPVASFHAPLGISSTVFYAEDDTRVTEEHVARWKNIIIGSGLFSHSPSGFGTMTNSEAEFKVEKIPGNHNFFYNSEARSKWMEIVIQVLDKLLIDLEYGF